MKPESAGFGPIPGKTRGFLADTILHVMEIRVEELDGIGHEARPKDRELVMETMAEEFREQGRVVVLLRPPFRRFGNLPLGVRPRVLAASAQEVTRGPMRYSTRKALSGCWPRSRAADPYLDRSS